MAKSRIVRHSANRRASHLGLRPPVRRPYPWHAPGPFPNYLAVEDVTAILAAAKADETRFGLRNYLVLGTSYFYGLRASEAGLILVPQLDLEAGTLRIDRQKHGFTRNYLLHAPLAEPFRRYLPLRPLPSGAPDPMPDDCNVLFPSKDLVYNPGEAPCLAGLSGKSVHLMLLHYAELVGVLEKYRSKPGYVRAHSLKHSIATHLLNAGWDLIDVKHQLGLVSERSVRRYAWFTDLRMDARMAQLSGHRAIARI
jgi:integrase